MDCVLVERSSDTIDVAVPMIELVRGNFRINAHIRKCLLGPEKLLMMPEGGEVRGHLD